MCGGREGGGIPGSELRSVSSYGEIYLVTGIPGRVRCVCVLGEGGLCGGVGWGGEG